MDAARRTVARRDGRARDRRRRRRPGRCAGDPRARDWEVVETTTTTRTRRFVVRAPPRFIARRGPRGDVIRRIRSAGRASASARFFSPEVPRRRAASSHPRARVSLARHRVLARTHEHTTASRARGASVTSRRRRRRRTSSYPNMSAVSTSSSIGRGASRETRVTRERVGRGGARKSCARVARCGRARRRRRALGRRWRRV